MPPDSPKVLADAAPLIATASGLVSGTIDQGMLSYRAIPYAQAPTGALRFAPPRPATQWPGVRDCADFGPACAQLVVPDGPEIGAELQDEDALSLNVWTPGIGGPARPVMVWIHGGALIEGSARNPWYNGARLAASGQVVVVSIQYRLGVFGFLNLAGIGGEAFADSGNAGLLDQVAALRWVRENIAAFGGDAGNVTIFGESAGGASVLLLMHMPAARGLFHKAIAQSPSPQFGRLPDRSAAIAQQLLQLAGVASVSDLQALSTQQLLDAQQALMHSGLGPDAFWPTRGTPALPLHAVTAAATGAVAAVPLVLGTTLDELCYWTELEGLPLFDRPQALWRTQLADVAGNRLDAVEQAYAHAHLPDEAEARRQQRLQLLGDLNFRLPCIRVAESLSRGGRAVWMYLFTYRSTATDARHDSAHAMELPFLFGNLDAPLVESFTGCGPGRTVLQANLQQAWTSFAHHGQPQVPGLGAWPRYDTGRRTTLDLNIDCHFRDDPLAAQRRVWADVPFDGQVPDERAITRLTFSDV